MSIHTNDLRDIASNHGWPVCDLAADEIEDLERAYALLFAENAKLRAAVDALPAGDVGAGWQMVPMEPTPEMIEAAGNTAGMRAIDGASSMHQLRGNPLPAAAFADGSPMQQAYRAMLAAAPSPIATLSSKAGQEVRG